MDIKLKITDLEKLFLDWSGEIAENTHAMPISGSERRYYRMTAASGKTALGVYNNNRFENSAFVNFTQKFRGIGINVPEIYISDLDQDIYMVQDLGDLSLLQYLENERKLNKGNLSDNVFDKYKSALEQLAFLQIEGAKVINYDNCYPSSEFDQKSMMADCHLFKYWFLFPTHAIFDDSLLEKDFETLCQYLYEPECPFFMFRDFQARNIMVSNEQLYFIDYQGGRKGPLQYDVASLLFQAKAALPAETRKLLLDHYFDTILQYTTIEKADFYNRYYGLVLLRSMQVLGAYGFKGYYQRKEHFISSIPYAIENLRWWLDQIDFPLELPELKKVLGAIIKRQDLFPNKENAERSADSKPLKLHLRSFSYKKGLPEDTSGGHGQGFIFDCRLIHNPGRYEHFKMQSGLDRDVKEFLEKDGEMAVFLAPIIQILEQAIDKYLQRGFEYLGINFGCTGGQHRSVYATETIAAYLSKKYGNEIMNIIIEHREKESWLKK